MHVRSTTRLSGEAVHERFQQRFGESASQAGLVYVAERTPPKFFLGSEKRPLPPAAEVSVSERQDGSDVTLRLMAGPLPAPFPRAVAVLGVLLGVACLFASSGATVGAAVGVLLAGAPLLWLYRQRRGERSLQTQLRQSLEGSAFEPVAH